MYHKRSLESNAEMIPPCAQSLLAALLLADLRFTRREAIVLALLFAGQLFFPDPTVRWFFFGLYMVAVVGVLSFGPPAQRQAFFQLMFARSPHRGD